MHAFGQYAADWQWASAIVGRLLWEGSPPESDIWNPVAPNTPFWTPQMPGVGEWAPERN